MIVPGMFVYSSFLISVYVYSVESFANIECYGDCSRRGSHLVDPLCYGVIECVCSAVTVECCVLYPCCMGVFGMFAVM